MMSSICPQAAARSAAALQQQSSTCPSATAANACNHITGGKGACAALQAGSRLVAEQWASIRPPLDAPIQPGHNPTPSPRLQAAGVPPLQQQASSSHAPAWQRADHRQAADNSQWADHSPANGYAAAQSPPAAAPAETLPQQQDSRSFGSSDGFREAAQSQAQPQAPPARASPAAAELGPEAGQMVDEGIALLRWSPYLAWHPALLHGTRHERSPLPQHLQKAGRPLQAQPRS